MLFEKTLALVIVSWLSPATPLPDATSPEQSRATVMVGAVLVEGVLVEGALVEGALVEGALLAKDWIAKVTDSICGLRDPNQVSNPAQIDFKACLDATQEMRKLVRDKIDVTTPEGIRLSNDAVNRVTSACETVRVANGYCSVWKTIKHKDARVVSDISEQVKALF